MYLLYVDESGNPHSDTDGHFVLGGLAVFERQAYYLSRDVDRLQRRLFPDHEGYLPFHASEITGRRKFWRSQSPEKRAQTIAELGKVIAKSNHPGVVLLASAVERRSDLPGEELVKRATEDLCRRFDLFLMRRHHEFNDPQRGLLILADSKFSGRSRSWVKDFRDLGTKWGVVRNLCDIPFFAGPEETRLLQLADYVAHAVFRQHERADASWLNPIAHRFDQAGGILNGVGHIRHSRALCDCPGCKTRREPYAFPLPDGTSSPEA
jgi:hypothetical protein